jgi:zinc transporter
MNIAESGIYNYYLLDGKGGFTALSKDELSEQDFAMGPVWLDLKYTDPSVREWLTSQSGLEDVVYEASVAEDTRPRMVQMGDSLLVILRGINLNPGADPDDMISIRLWITEKMIISTRMDKLYSIEDVKRVLEQRKGPRNSVEFLVELTAQLVARMTEPIDQLEERITDIESRVVLSEDSDLRSALADLRRHTIELRRFIAPHREVLAELQNEKYKRFKKYDRQVLHEIYQRLVRHVEDLDAIRERATITAEEILSHISDRMNHRMYILSLVAAIFIPLGFLTGLLGVNIAGIPGAEYPNAFSVFIIIMLIIVAFQVWLFKRKKWF